MAWDTRLLAGVASWQILLEQNTFFLHCHTNSKRRQRCSKLMGWCQPSWRHTDSANGAPRMLPSGTPCTCVRIVPPSLCFSGWEIKIFLGTGHSWTPSWGKWTRLLRCVLLSLRVSGSLITNSQSSAFAITGSSRFFANIVLRVTERSTFFKETGHFLANNLFQYG